MAAHDDLHPLGNAEIARVFDEVARLLEAMRDSPFKIQAYRTAARTIAGHSVELRDIVASGGDLREIPGVGEAIASKTAELLATGRLEYMEKLRRSLPAGVMELMEIPGIGPRTAARLVAELHVASIGELEAALRSGAVAHVRGVGVKKAGELLNEIELHRGRTAGESSG